MDLFQLQAGRTSRSTAAPTVVVQAGIRRSSMAWRKSACGRLRLATIGMFAKAMARKVDEVVVVDDHITGVLSEHQAGKLLDIPDTGIKMKGRPLDARAAISRSPSPAQAGAARKFPIRCRCSARSIRRRRGPG
jgi:hypothetical protein